LHKLVHPEILPDVQDQHQNNEQNRLQDFLVKIIWNEITFTSLLNALDYTKLRG